MSNLEEKWPKPCEKHKNCYHLVQMTQGARECFGCWLAGVREAAREEALEEADQIAITEAGVSKIATAMTVLTKKENEIRVEVAREISNKIRALKRSQDDEPDEEEEYDCPIHGRLGSSECPRC